jgi:S1-C subfamily serine protease
VNTRRPAVRRAIRLLLPVVLATWGLSSDAARSEGVPQAPPAAAAEKALARALEIESELVASLERVRRSTVSILHMRAGRKDGPLFVAAVGTGILVNRRKTYVVTNVHVVQGAADLRVVTADGRSHRAKLVDQVKTSDIALLGFVDGPPKGFRGVSVEERTPFEEGSWVVATGNPFFLANDGQSVATLGVVSGKDRILGGKFVYGKAIQHDSEVNPGNSGGPLWNLKGQLLGINGMIASQQSAGSGPHNTGCSFAIPVEQVSQFLDAMIDPDQSPEASSLGIDYETTKDKKGNPIGALVTRSSAGGPRSKSVIEGDVITKVFADGKWTRILTASDLTNLLALLPARTEVKVEYRRGRSTEVWKGTLGAR